MDGPIHTTLNNWNKVLKGFSMGITSSTWLGFYFNFKFQVVGNNNNL